MNLDLYGHLFPDEMDRLAEHLDAAHSAASVQIAASVRHEGDAEVIRFPSRDRKSPSDQGFSSWGGEDLNLRLSLSTKMQSPRGGQPDVGRENTMTARQQRGLTPALCVCVLCARPPGPLSVVIGYRRFLRPADLRKC